MEGAGTIVSFLVCVFVYMALDAMKESLSLITRRRHLLEFERACFGDFSDALASCSQSAQSVLQVNLNVLFFFHDMVFIYAQGWHTFF